jgi:hypothetical protein
MNPAALGALLKGDIDNAVIAASPGGIEAQEAAGQRNLVAHADRLPVAGTIAGLHGPKVGQREQWEKVGFVFGEPLSGPDQIFVACTFPNGGWTLKETEHSMWSNLLDDKGRKRASVFFKAAFYDYNAHTFGLECRYRVGSTYDDHRATAVVVQDTATGADLHTFPLSSDRDYAERDRLDKEAQDWLDANFPDWKDPMAYWD